jgi:hypothetical protein
MKWWFVPLALLSATNIGDVRTGNDFLAKCGQAKAEFCSAMLFAADADLLIRRNQTSRLDD